MHSGTRMNPSVLGQKVKVTAWPRAEAYRAWHKILISSWCDVCLCKYMANSLRMRSPVFTGSVFQSASCSKSRYLATEQWTAVRLRTCRPTSPALLMCHLDWDSDHLLMTKWLCHPSTSLPKRGSWGRNSALVVGGGDRRPCALYPVLSNYLLWI